MRVREESRLTQVYGCHFQRWEELDFGVEIKNLVLDVLSSRCLLDNQVGMLIGQLDICMCIHI